MIYNVALKEGSYLILLIMVLLGKLKHSGMKLFDFRLELEKVSHQCLDVNQKKDPN